MNKYFRHCHLLLTLAHARQNRRVAHEKNAKLREEKNNMTVDDVVLMQKAKAEYAASLEKSISEQLSMQEKVQLNSSGLPNGNTVRENK